MPPEYIYLEHQKSGTKAKGFKYVDLFWGFLTPSQTIDARVTIAAGQLSCRLVASFCCPYGLWVASSGFGNIWRSGGGSRVISSRGINKKAIEGRGWWTHSDFKIQGSNSKKKLLFLWCKCLLYLLPEVFSVCVLNGILLRMSFSFFAGHMTTRTWGNPEGKKASTKDR